MKRFLAGDEALAEGVRLARPQVISAYPITPQTVVVERLSEMVEDGSLAAEYVHVESEHSALSCAIGASATGARTFDVYKRQYLYFEQDEDSPVAFAEEALAGVPRAKSIACTDRASLSELIVALNGYTVTSGILVGISDGAGLNTVPLETDVRLHLGYVVRKGGQLGEVGQRFVDTLKKNLERYARF